MKIAIPTANGQLAMHFGHCQQFTFVDVEPESKTINSTMALTPPPHEPGVLPRWLAEHGANVIIGGGMGQRAQALFAQNGIEVVVGATSAPPEEIVKAWLEDTLVTGANACDH